MELLNSIIAGVIAVCTLVATLSPFILVFVKKIKNDQLRQIAEDSVAFAEQMAANQKKIDDTKVSGKEKYAVASAKLAEGAKLAGIKVKPEMVSMLLESTLGKYALGK